MKRAIVKRFIVVLIVAMAISSIVISMSYYRLASHRVMEDMKSVLLLLDATIDWESSDLEKQIVEISSQMNNDYRITIIDNDGSVLADSETGNPETMENHKNRKEVKEASRRLWNKGAQFQHNQRKYDVCGILFTNAA